jgi:ATP-dependent DNA helicase RecG
VTRAAFERTGGGRSRRDPVSLASLRRLVARREGVTLEFKRSTGELREGLEILCAFLNTRGGTVLLGVNRRGEVLGQQVSEQTIHEVTAAFERFEPPAVVEIERVVVAPGREVLAVRAEANREGVPFTFDGRAYERVGNTTRKMSQKKYESLLLERAHARRRWENQPAVGVGIRDLDREEILRTREAAIRNRRITPGTSTKVEDILDRLGLRRDGVLTQAAHVLYGTRFLPDYPQCLLKLGRFRGTEITGDILDNKQEHMHAFAMVREAMAWLDRTLPLSARFPTGEIFREDRLPVPPDALREILLNAVMHRDYADQPQSSKQRYRTTEAGRKLLQG